MPASAATDPLAVRVLYSPHEPTPPQHAFLLLDELGVLEAGYGGAAGGGKSDALLMAAMRYVDVPGYAALLLRRTFADLNMPGALMDRAKSWLGGRVAWNERDSRFTFPSGATLSFGYLQTSNDRYRYQGGEYQFVGFDELTQFDQADYRYLFTRLRKPAVGAASTAAERARVSALSAVPLRMRWAANPGGRGHAWVHHRLVKRLPDPDDENDTVAKSRARVFIPARLDDNPHVDADGYRRNLAQIDPTLRAQMLRGDWDARQPGDWVYDADGLDAAIRLGAQLDADLAQGIAPPPVGGVLRVGIDWGEHTAFVIGWPLLNGGMWVVHTEALESVEAGVAAKRMRALLAEVVELGSVQGPRGTAPALRADVDPLTLVDAHNYDAAGVGAMRTYMAAIRRRHPTARTRSVPFGAPAPRSGSGAGQGHRSYKAETIGYLRRLLGRSLHGIERYDHEDFDPLNAAPPAVPNVDLRGALAISPVRCGQLIEQFRALEWLDRAAGTVRKTNDHGPDACIALEAPDAVRHR